MACTPRVDTLPVLALTGRSGVAIGWDRPVPAEVSHVAVRRPDGVYVGAVTRASRVLPLPVTHSFITKRAVMRNGWVTGTSPIGSTALQH
jgi:hypothetical protein